MAYFYRLIILCFLFLAAGFSFAAIPAVNKSSTNFNQYGINPSAESVCRAWVASGPAGYGTFYRSASGPEDFYGSPSMSCGVSLTSDSSIQHGLILGTYGSCPANSTQSGSSCTCNVPFVENASQTACVAPVDPAIEICNDAQTIQNSTIGQPYQEVTVSGQHSSNSVLCIPTVGPNGSPVGCTMNFNLDIGYGNPDGSWDSRGTVDTAGGFTTLPCDLTNPAPTEPPVADIAKCPAGQQMGQINGVDSCQPRGPAVTSTTKDSTETKTGPDGTETIETETSCTGNKCSTTSTSSSGSSHTTTSTKDSYCQKNPTSSQCGSASSGGSGSGDEDGDCTPGNDLLKCAKFGNAGGSDPQLANTNKPMTISSDTGWGPSTGSCPAPRPINLSFGTINMPFDLLCQFADGIRPLVLGLAYLGAAFTFFGIGRKT